LKRRGIRLFEEIAPVEEEEQEQQQQQHDEIWDQLLIQRLSLARYVAPLNSS